MVEESKDASAATTDVQHTVTTKDQTEAWLTENEIQFHVSWAAEGPKA